MRQSNNVVDFSRVSKHLKRAKGITDPKFYAVATPATATEPAVSKRKPIAELKTEKLSEFRAKTKIDRAANALDRLEAEIAAIAKQESALKRRKQIKQARLARIENGVIAEMEKASLTKCDGWKRLFTLRPGPPAVQVTDETLIPAEYMHEEIIRRPEKNVIKAALALGFTVTQPAAVPAGFIVGGVPNNTAIKTVLDAGGSLPGIEALESIPGISIASKAVLGRK